MRPRLSGRPHFLRMRAKGPLIATGAKPDNEENQVRSVDIISSETAANDNGGHDAHYETAVLSIARLLARHGASARAATATANYNRQPEENAS
jgi:hypothetical protein